ncbi:putative transcription factor WD40-like family [Helianthus annuus]|nr:putative transcription factor WD40-like family [Helianthus annuus]
MIMAKFFLIRKTLLKKLSSMKKIFLMQILMLKLLVCEADDSFHIFTGHTGKTICTGSDDASLRVWNPRTGENIHVVKGHYYHTEGLTCLTIIADSSLVLTGSKDGSSVHIVNIATGKVVSSLASHSDSNRALS